MAPQKLTDAQREQAAQYERLIDWFRQAAGLHDDDWYGVIAVALCKAAVSYDVQKGVSFKVFAIRCMTNAVISEYRYQKAHCVPLTNVIDVDLIVAIPLENEYTVIEINEMLDRLPDLERDIISLYSQGYTMADIARVRDLPYNKVLRRKKNGVEVLKTGMIG